MITIGNLKHLIEEKKRRKKEKRYLKKMIKKYHNVNIVDYLTETKKV